MSLGNIYLKLEQINKSLEYLYKAKNIALDIGSSSSLGTIYLNLGNAYLMQDDLDSALNCYQTNKVIFSQTTELSTLKYSYEKLYKWYSLAYFS